MSRIGRKIISVPAGVKVLLQGGNVNVEGPLGKLSFTPHPSVKVAWNESEKSVAVTTDEKADNYDEITAHWGTARAEIQNMIIGVTKGYEKSMEVVGVGWAASLAGKQLKLIVGYANPIMLDIPAGVKIVVEKQIVRVSGPSKHAVGQFAAQMRAKRKPEPYNGKGIKYLEEVIKRKQGKQFGA
jgi:large subunit ribosomal protein L6